MRRVSIFFWITFIFLLAFIGLGASYLLSIKYLKASSNIRIEKRFNFISQTLIWQLNKSKDIERLKKDLEKIDMVLMSYPKEIIKVLKTSKLLKRRVMPLGEILLLKKDNEYYIFVKSLGNALLIKDMSSLEDYKILYTAIFIIMMILLLVVYILVILKLRPLKKITKEIEKFSKGKLDLDLNIKSSKEINEVAKALNEAAISLKNIQESRRLLLRNIMHELKTPITKGRITAEMIENKKQKERLIMIFEKLNSLINEFAALEAVNSKIKPNLEEIYLKDIVDEAINAGMFDKKDIKIEIIHNPIIKGDYKLLVIAFKNLLDNALKYSTSYPIIVKMDKKSISFINTAKPLENELDYYTKAFTKEHRKSGFGLGLYLVLNILKLHKFRLKYRYVDGKNIFSVIFEKF
jgi:two-component system OmpR family sensor kinase